ncbi:MAG: hypothetical protein FJ186_00040 [Gammaproteobacteria bacterium]|nr:hypothetical protein [Gammaproteobacteria bacterium]
MMQTVIISLMLTTLAIAQEEAASKYNLFDSCANKGINPGGEAAVKCAYRQSLMQYLTAQTLTSEEQKAMTVTMSDSSSSNSETQALDSSSTAVTAQPSST